MKLDKETIIALCLSLALLVAWGVIKNQIWGPTLPHTRTQETTAPTKPDNKVNKKTVKKPEEIVTDNSKKTKKPKQIEKPQIVIDNPKIKKLQPVSIENDCIKAEINPNAGDISSVVLKKYFRSNRVTYRKTNENIVLLKNVKSGALGLIPEKPWILTNIKLETEKDGTPEKVVTLFRKFKTNTGIAFSITQKWQIKENYTIKYNLKITNLANSPLTLKELKLSAGGLPNIHELANDKTPFRENHEIDYCNAETHKVESRAVENRPGFISMIFGGGKKSTSKKGFENIEYVNATWIGVANKYFASILVPEKTFEDGIVCRATVHDRDKPEKKIKQFLVGETDALINVKELSKNTDLKLSFDYFIGPKKIPLLKKLAPNASKIMKLYMLGMKFLEPISSLMLNALLWLQGICGSYGLSIVLLTLIVKTLLWPVTHKANVSMRKMQRINPLIQEVRKKYKDNPQKVNTEMMKLYKEHKVNPLGGCLPILLQMPIFFALYAALSGAVEPRHTAFLWINDLTLPDTVAHIPWTTVPINPLMLTMTATMVLQQKLTPSAADPAQQRMMMFMPLIMLVMLYSLPSGLTLYWTVSQLISIAQLVVNKKLEKRAEMAIESKK